MPFRRRRACFMKARDRLKASPRVAARTPFPKEKFVSMPKLTFIDASGQSRSVEAQVGATVMETALRNSVPGIEAECGGACACATCHVYVAPEWTEATGKASQMEEDMLDFAFEVRPNSRLSCQIKVSEALDGLVVTTPPKQG
jgi:ferredoxin, 2Fe-2S